MKDSHNPIAILNYVLRVKYHLVSWIEINHLCKILTLLIA